MEYASLAMISLQVYVVINTLESSVSLTEKILTLQLQNSTKKSLAQIIFVLLERLFLLQQV
jgi:hypothetical protein